MVLDYEYAWRLSKDNSAAHLDAAKMLLEDHPGFAVSHAMLAYEEAAKAVCCALVSSGMLTSSDIELVFRRHEPKALMYGLLFESSFTITESDGKFQVTAKAEPLVSQLKKAAKEERDSPEVKRHNGKRNEGFYVSAQGDEEWQSPDSVPIPWAADMVKKYRGRTLAMIGAASLFLEAGLRRFNKLDNLRAILNGDGTITGIRIDEQ